MFSSHLLLIGGDLLQMPQVRSTAYFQPLCDKPAITTLRSVLFTSKLRYSEKVLILALLLEPKFQEFGTNGNWQTERGTLALVARKLRIETAAVSRWYSNFKKLAPFTISSELDREGKQRKILLA